uniref:galactose-3-O-sulfotransferase 2-like n=1 Tax=Pristiophorus japonicus TaxID=55135 RepID=UPI00398EAF75
MARGVSSRRAALTMACTVSMRTMQIVLLFIVVASFSFMGRTMYHFTSTGSRGPTCTPRENVMFLKTHKTASSTMLNILYRYGDARNLTFALPLYDHLGYPKRFKAEFVRAFVQHRHHEYHIMCNHMRFHLPEVKRVMPNGSFYFSIIRNPIQLAESAFAYFHAMSPAFSLARSLEEFVSDTARFYRSGPNNHYARNLMWFDFGGDHEAGAGDVEAALRGLDAAFDLVLVAEYFDQSLVLLHEALCWRLEDVAYFRLNLRHGASVVPLGPGAAAKIRAWNGLDWELYRHFNATFWRLVAAYGATRMERDVARLRELCRGLAATCLRGGAAGQPVDARLIAEPGLKPKRAGKANILGYALREGLSGPEWELCRRMVMPEKFYLQLLQRKQSLSPGAGSPPRTPSQR